MKKFKIIEHGETQVAAKTDSRVLKYLLRCQTCGKQFKRLNKYAYKPMCKHYPKTWRLSVG